MEQFNQIKTLNKAITELQIKKGNYVLKNHPYLLSIDVSSFCQLKCKFCPTGTGKRHWPKTTLRVKDFKKIIDQLESYLFTIEFGNWGEPLLCDNVFKMIKYAKKFGVFCQMNTNLHNLNKKTIAELVNSGLDYLNITISGTTQKTYEKYKIGGSFELVMNNLQNLVDFKKRYKKSHPFVKWQYLVFKHNEKEIEQAKKIANDMGIDEFALVSPWIYDIYKNKSWCSCEDKYNRYNFNMKGSKCANKNQKEFCLFPWSRITINANGSVFPCCGDIDENYKLGNILETPFSEIWNNERYQNIRKYLLHKTSSTKNCCVECKDLQNSSIES